MDPLERVVVDHDTTFSFMLEAQARGHEVYYCTQRELVARGARLFAHAELVEVQREQGRHFSVLVPSTPIELTEVDVVFVRTDPPFDSEYLFATNLLSLLGDDSEAGAPLVVNDPRGLREAQEHLYSLRFPEVIPETVVTSRRDEILAFMDAHGGQAVMKPVDGHGGEGVLLIRRDDQNLSALLELGTSHFARRVLVQRYLPEIHQSGDARVLLLDGEVIGACARLPRSGELRGNIHAGGRVEKYELTARDRAVCETVAPALKADGLHFVGLDLIGGYLTEVNVTSPTCVQEIDRLYDVNLEARVIEFVEREVAARR